MKQENRNGYSLAFLYLEDLVLLKDEGTNVFMQWVDP